MHDELKKAVRSLKTTPAGVVPDVILVHGGAKGADLMADALWREKVDPAQIEIHKPDYDNWPRRVAPLKRNELMVSTNPDLVLAFQTECFKTSCHEDMFHYSHGTQYTIDYAQSKGLTVRIFRDPPF